MGVRAIIKQPEPMRLAGRGLPTVQIQQRHQLRVIAGLAAGQDHGDRTGAVIGQRMDLRAQTAPGTTQRTISRLDRQIRVIRWSPLCQRRTRQRPPRRGGAFVRRPRADAPGQPSSRSTAAVPDHRRNRSRTHPRCALHRTSAGTSHPLTSGNDAATRCAKSRTPPEDHARAIPSGTARRSPPRFVGDRSTGVPDAQKTTATPAPQQPRTRPRTPHRAPFQDHHGSDASELADML